MPALLRVSCVISDKLLPLSVLQFLHRHEGVNNDTYFTELLQESLVSEEVKPSEQGPTYYMFFSKCSCDYTECEQVHVRPWTHLTAFTLPVSSSEMPACQQYRVPVH